jgi:hypothetical protein
MVGGGFFLGGDVFNRADFLFGVKKKIRSRV